jgi:phosphatidylglycerophosphate synthase
MKGENYVTGFICLVAGVFLGIATTIPKGYVESPLGAAFWPKLILLSLFVTSGVHLTRMLLRKKEGEEQLAREAEKAQKRNEEETGERKVFSLFLFGIVISFIYIYSLRWIGFTVATPIFVAVFMYVTG